MILHLLKRLVLILLGYGLATLASGAVVTGVYCATDPPWLRDLPGIFVLITLLIGIYAALPAVIAVAVGEVMPIRRRLYYMVIGCLIGTGLPLYVQLEWWYVPVGFVFGFAAGLIYWSVAGQRAGLTRPAA